MNAQRDNSLSRVDERKAAIAESRRMLNQADQEKRTFTVLEAAKFDRLLAQVSEIDEAVSKLKQT